MTKTMWAVALSAAIAVGGTLAIASALGDRGAGPSLGNATWTTVLNSTVPIEGLTGDNRGNLYVAARGATALGYCPVWRVSATGSANQTPVTVARVPAPCNPSGIALGPDGRLYITGFGATGDQIAVTATDAASPPTATTFATGTPGANGLAFDRDGNLYASEGGTAQGRVFRVGPAGGAAAELFRVPPMTNSAGVGRVNSSVQPGLAPAPQNIVANGLAFTSNRTLLVADTARGALWEVSLDRDGNVQSPTGCDTTFTADTLCFDDVLVQHPYLEGADGIALDRAGNVWVDPNERNAVVVVDRHSRVRELFRNPVVGNLRNAGPLEFPTSPFLTGRTFCTTQSDGNRRDNSPNTAGETQGTGKISCLDQRLQVPGE